MLLAWWLAIFLGFVFILVFGYSLLLRQQVLSGHYHADISTLIASCWMPGENHYITSAPILSGATSSALPANGSRSGTKMTFPSVMSAAQVYLSVIVPAYNEEVYC